MTTPKYYNETVGVSVFVHEGRFTVVKLSVCGCASQLHDFSQDIRTLSGAHTCTGPAGDIRGGLHSYFLIVM